uniref:Uncharacterized protein n=1 Tax=Physcomitrium patens TaxID=3218 RepID=A0A2K1L0Y3_PHYPA|nr:hypothetical protein PHYPA_002482 [Physcomitrium patens]
MIEQMDVSTFIFQVYEIQWDLTATGQPQSNAILVHRTLNRIPFRFQNLAWQIENKRDILSLPKLSARLHNEEHYIFICQDEPKEALMMPICNVVERHYKSQQCNYGFRSSRYPLGGHQKQPINADYFIYNKCKQRGYTSRYCPALTPPRPRHHTSMPHKGDKDNQKRFLGNLRFFSTWGSFRSGEDQGLSSTYGADILKDTSGELYLSHFP